MCESGNSSSSSCYAHVAALRQQAIWRPRSYFKKLPFPCQGVDRWQPRALNNSNNSNADGSKNADGSRTIRCILPFHPCLARHAWKAIERVNDRYSGFLKGCKFGIAFRANKSMRLESIAKRGKL